MESNDEHENQKEVILRPNATAEMDETEDEEVKRNCFGMKFYTTTSCSSDYDTESLRSEDSNDGEKDGWNKDSDEASTISTCSESSVGSSKR